MLIPRPQVTQRIARSFRVHPAVAITGPRQCGKTTLAEQFALAGAPASEDAQVAHFDLERAADRQRLQTPEQTLSPLKGLVVIDEIQREPGLFEALRVLLDRRDWPARYLILGSASPALMQGASETLAGRVGVVDLGGFDLAEVARDQWRSLWHRGAFPRSFLAEDEGSSALWREAFVETFLLRDIVALGITVPAEALRRFWTMVAHYHGQVWNAAEFARAIGTGQAAARRHLDILAAARMVRVLPPWFENLKKRQVRAPKIYVRDSGMLHTLLGLGTADALHGHPKVGASFEGFAIEQILSCFAIREAYFWRTHGGAELDLLLNVNGRRMGFEFKHSDAPGTTKSMHSAMQDLRLDHLWVVYPGDERYPLAERITALPVRDIPSLALAKGN